MQAAAAYRVPQKQVRLGHKKRQSKAIGVLFDKGSYFIVLKEKTHLVKPEFVHKRLRKFTEKDLRKFIQSGGKIQVYREPDGDFRLEIDGGGLSGGCKGAVCALGGTALGLYVLYNIVQFIKDMRAIRNYKPKTFEEEMEEDKRRCEERRKQFQERMRADIEEDERKIQEMMRRMDEEEARKNASESKEN